MVIVVRGRSNILCDTSKYIQKNTFKNTELMKGGSVNW